MKEKFKRFLNAYVRFVQRILITILLTTAYLFAVGITFLLALVFRFRMVRPKRRRGQASYWDEAREYHFTIEDARRQS